MILASWSGADASHIPALKTSSAQLSFTVFERLPIEYSPANTDLHIIVVGVYASFCEQAFMCPPLCDPVFGDDDDLIRAPDRGQPVSDGDGRPVFGKLFQTLLNPALAFVVKGACRFIQDQDGRVFQEDTGNGDALFLSPLRDGRRVLPHRCHTRPGVPG